jgi:hypothetical protein
MGFPIVKEYNLALSRTLVMIFLSNITVASLKNKIF